MSSKENILSNIRNNVHDTYDMPDISIKGVQYEDTLQQFVDMTKTVGGKVRLVKPDEDINAIVRELYPDAMVIASNLPSVTIATVNPDEVDRPQDLNGTDVAIIQGEIGVAENGCIWIPQAVKEKVVYFISENLVILLPASKVVNNMHEAYSEISFN